VSRVGLCLVSITRPRNNSLTHTVHRHTACKQHSQQERDAAKDLPERKMRQTMDMRAESAEKLEPWLSSCRAVEAPSRRCRGAVEALPVEPVEFLSSSCLVPVPFLSSLSRLVEADSMRRAAGVSSSCRGLSSCRVAVELVSPVELSSCRAVAYSFAYRFAYSFAYSFA